MFAQLGDYEFEVSLQNVSTFSDLKFSNSAQYTEHKILNSKGLLEFTGLNASTCSLKMKLVAGLTDSIDETISYFYDAMNDGMALVFIIGGGVMGQGLWVIETLEESYPEISNTGQFWSVELNMSLKEYLDDEE